MKFAAFFRNLNLGRPPAPAKAELEAAFMDAGAASAQSFLTNGTVVFTAGSARQAAKMLAGVRTLLQERLGFEEPAFVRSLPYLAKLVERDPFEPVDKTGVYECCVTFVGEKVHWPAELPSANRRGDVEVVELTRAEALCVARKLGSSPGSPNAFIERELGAPASTRAWNTVRRLVERHGS